MRRTNQGITLIALIITIIVMLVLVTVSVSVVVESDLIGAAEKTSDKYKKEQEQTVGPITIENKTYASIEEYINRNQISGVEKPEIPAEPGVELGLTLSLKNHKTEVTADGTYVSEVVNGVPIPVGFTKSGIGKEQNVNGGFVIYDLGDATIGEGFWTEDSDNNGILDVHEKYNQFVWVPVLQNQTIEIKAGTEANITGVTIKDPLARTTNITTDKDGQPFATGGTTLVTEINPTINGLYTVTITTENESETLEETIRITSLYAQDFYVDYMYPTEPYRDASMKKYLEYTDPTVATYKPSVNKYGGFYIARYEAGTETVSILSSATPLSKKNLYPYNFISQTDALLRSNSMYTTTKTSITSTLLNAATWDRTINWLEETDSIEVSDILNSTGLGNYTDSSFNFTGKYATSFSSWSATEGINMEKPANKLLLGTGVTEYTNRNNIYDLAGNFDEWTTEEVTSSGKCVYRGGYCNSSGSSATVSDRFEGGTSYIYYGDSFRPVLYINQ